MSRRTMMHRNDLVAKLDVTSPAVQNKINALQQGFASKGLNPFTAKQAALQAIDGSVMRQTAVLSYMDVFLYLGVLFLICIPFMLLVKGNKKKKAEKLDMSAAH